MSETGAEAKLAARITNAIKDLIDRQEPDGPRRQTAAAAARRYPGAGAPARQTVRRGAAGTEAAHIPVAGADRLKLTEHIAIIDLMSLADAILMPTDDLSLAVALKSPLFGLTEEQLFKLAHGAHGLAARRAGRARSDRREFKAAHRPPERLRGQGRASFAVCVLLVAARKRSRPLAHSRPAQSEANDALDEFLELALRYEQREPATLQGFMAWLRATDIEIKRDMEISRDEVRVMTVHGAKGLEAPVVFLMDTTSTPLDNVRLSLIRFPVRHDTRRRPTAWCGPAARRTIRTSSQRARQRWSTTSSTSIAACSMSR